MVEIESVGFLVDRLVVANIKMSLWNHEQVDEGKKPDPNKDKIVELDRKIRATNEERVALKNAIDIKLKDAVENGKYDYHIEERTYPIRKEDMKIVQEEIKEHTDELSER